MILWTVRFQRLSVVVGGGGESVPPPPTPGAAPCAVASTVSEFTRSLLRRRAASRWCGRLRRPPPRGRPRRCSRPSSCPARRGPRPRARRSEEHTSELQSRGHLVCRLLLE